VLRELLELVDVDNLLDELGAAASTAVSSSAADRSLYVSTLSVSSDARRSAADLMKNSAKDKSSLCQNDGWTTYKFFKFFLYLHPAPSRPAHPVMVSPLAMLL